MISPHHKRIGDLPRGNSYSRAKPLSPNLVQEIPAKPQSPKRPPKTTAMEKTLPPGVRDFALRTQSNPILKDEVFFEKYGAENGGEYTRIRVKVAPGGGTPLHYHNTYAEYFLAQDGDLSLILGEETKVLKSGEKAKVPIGTKHRFFNANTDRDVKFVTELRPAHEGFERTLHIIYGLARDGEVGPDGMPKSLVVAALLGEMSDMSIPGWTMTIGRPVMKALAAYGRWTGEEDRLLKKYWY